MLVGVEGQPELTVGLGQLVTFNDPPHTVELVVRINGEARVKMRQQRFAAGLQRQHFATSERPSKLFERLQPKRNFFNRFE